MSFDIPGQKKTVAASSALKLPTAQTHRKLIYTNWLFVFDLFQKREVETPWTCKKKTKRIWHPQTAETSKFVSLVLPANVTKRHKTETPQPSLQSSQRDAIDDHVSHQTFFSK